METDFEIGDKVNVRINDEMAFTGELLGLSSDTNLIQFWIVLIDKRFTDFMKNRPEKAVVVTHTYMKKIVT